MLILHSFGCLVSHVCERGILQRLHARFPEVSIQAIEYDYDQSKMLMYGKEASNRKQEVDRQHHTIPKQKPNDRIVESLFPCIF